MRVTDPTFCPLDDLSGSSVCDEQITASTSMRNRCAFLLALSCVLALNACGGGGGGGVEVGAGQDPDPVVVDFPVAYVKRPLTIDDEGVLIDRDLRELDTFEVGANLYVRERASPS